MDKVNDDKERSGESQSKRAKVGTDNGTISGLYLYVDGFKTWKRPEERFISWKCICCVLTTERFSWD